MYTTQSRHNRNALGVSRAYDRVNDVGLGLVITVTTKFDPQKMRVRLGYWLDEAANQMAEQFKDDVRASGMEPTEGGMVPTVNGRMSEREAYKQQALNRGLNDLVNWSASVPTLKGPNAVKTYAMMAVKMLVGIAFPWIGIGMTISSLFGKKKKKKMSVPWNAIYAGALPYAQGQTKAEELNRIAEEVARIHEERVVEVQKVRSKEVEFKLPDWVKSIDRGALVIAPVGQTVIGPPVTSITRKK